MKGGLEVVIHGDGFVFSFARGLLREELRGGEADVGQGLSAFREKHALTTRTVNLFVAEELVFGLELDLPLRTPDLKEAIGLQLGLSLPFPQDEMLSAYSISRRTEDYRVMIFATRAKTVAAVLEELIEDGFSVKGIYPEHQRYLTKWTSGRQWALVMPGRPDKAYVFGVGGQLKNRLLFLGSPPTFDELSRRCETGLIYHVDASRESGYRPAAELLAEAPLLKEYNLLPASYRRPDFLKMVIVALVALNLLALAAGVGFRFQRVAGLTARTEAGIAEILPLVGEVNAIRKELQNVEDFLASLAEIGTNPDLVDFIGKLTAELPADSYLDQFRFDSKARTVTINGFTDDLGAMTEKLQVLGGVRLKSTSRRQNRNYFQVEIALP
jgi:hypothetical protein